MWFVKLNAEVPSRTYFAHFSAVKCIGVMQCVTSQTICLSQFSSAALQHVSFSAKVERVNCFLLPSVISFSG